MIDEFLMIRRIEEILREGGAAGRDGTVEVPIGDDAAAIRLGGGRRLLATTDSLVQGVHFDPAAEDPEDLGYRAVASNVSDVCAMGGVPRWILASLVLPPATAADWVDRFARGVAEGARTAGVSVVGGNLSAGAQIVVSITMLGEMSTAPLRRSGARPGDGLYLTGPVGAAAAARSALRGGVAATPEHRMLDRRRARPPMRIEAARVLGQVASAAIDVSDGLAQDLSHLLTASGVSALIDPAAVPLAFGHPRDRDGPVLGLALSGGEDYELVAAIPPASERAASRLMAEAGISLYRFGEVTAQGPAGAVRVVGERGGGLPLDRAGYRHFSGLTSGNGGS